MSQSPNDTKAPEAQAGGTPTETKEPPMQAATTENNASLNPDKKMGGARPGAGRPVNYGDSALGVWLKAKGMTPSEAATSWDIPLRTIQHVLKTKNPTGKTAFLIEKKTNGEVPASVWFPLDS